MQFVEKSLEESIEEIFRISNEVFADFFPLDKFLKRLESRKYWIYVAEDKNEVIGYKIFYEDDDGQIYNWLDGVRSGYQDNGIGTALMAKEIDFAGQKGYSNIKLKTHIGHPKMIHLCNKFGFMEIKREAHHWGDNREAIFYELAL
jgi:ribosomal protein S18 acetylase RimI-like enzyme